MSDSAQQAKAQKKAYDEACKRVLSERGIMAHILKACTEEFKDCDLQDIAQRYILGEPSISRIAVEPEAISPRIESEQTEDKSGTEGTVYYDIRFHAVAPIDGKRIQLIINLEGLSLVEAGRLLLRPHDFQSVWYGFREIPLRKNPEGLFHLDLYDANEKMGVQYFQLPTDRETSNRPYTGREEPLRFNQYRPGLFGKQELSASERHLAVAEYVALG